jgi:site-specific DNA recombinase
MTPSSAKKQGLRYRYYVSRALIEGAADRAGSLSRIAAPSIEDAVLEALTPLAGQSPEDVDLAGPTTCGPRDPQILLEMVERVIVSRERFTLVFASDMRDQLQRDRLDVTWSPKPTRPRREVLAPNESNARPRAAEQRSTLIAAIARGRTWLAELLAGKTDLDAIASREKRSARSVQNTISLAFLSRARRGRRLSAERRHDDPPFRPPDGVATSTQCSRDRLIYAPSISADKEFRSKSCSLLISRLYSHAVY